mmetsp:Transcript_27810/g.58843  ORF Transcript_27810/g.58843 Transcript_27810/m.58843 type:complete len:202 (+) Transcript_27810:1480-2085(+)
MIAIECESWIAIAVSIALGLNESGFMDIHFAAGIASRTGVKLKLFDIRPPGAANHSHTPSGSSNRHWNRLTLAVALQCIISRGIGMAFNAWRALLIHHMFVSPTDFALLRHLRDLDRAPTTAGHARFGEDFPASLSGQSFNGQPVGPPALPYLNTSYVSRKALRAQEAHVPQHRVLGMEAAPESAPIAIKRVLGRKALFVL